MFCLLFPVGVTLLFRVHQAQKLHTVVLVKGRYMQPELAYLGGIFVCAIAVFLLVHWWQLKRAPKGGL
jgi:hypothetical protein